MERTTLKRLLSTVLIALLVATAGCSGFLGDDGGNDNGTSGAGYGVAGTDLNGQTLNDKTASAVESAGSYTVTTSTALTSSQQGQESTSNSVTALKVNIDENRGLRNRSQDYSFGNRTQEQTTVVYTDGSTSYRRQTSGGETTYDQQDGDSQSFDGITPVNTTTFAQNYTQIVDGFTWETAGSSQVNGVAVTEYELTGIEQKTALNIDENTTVEGTSGSLFVDSDGLIRKASVSYNLSNGDASTSIDATTKVTNVGSTTVAEPDWLSQAA